MSPDDEERLRNVGVDIQPAGRVIVRDLATAMGMTESDLVRAFIEALAPDRAASEIPGTF
jgi:hypothetical protein